MSVKLEIYNAALGHIGERRLASLTDNIESRRNLDTAWTDGPLYLLERAWWKFALRTVKLEYDSSVEPEFGFRRAFQMPSDYVRTYAMTDDEYSQSPLLQYHIEDNWVYVDQDEIFLRYVSNDVNRGMDTGAWPRTFRRALAFQLARDIAPHLVSKVKDEVLERGYKEAMAEAKNFDALEEPQQFPAPRGWSTARGASHRQNFKRFGR